MSTSNLNKIITSIIFGLLWSWSSFSQCPENKNELIINTEEKYEEFFQKYPNCKDYQIIKINGQFVGDPEPIKYLITLFFLLGGILFLLRLIIDRLKLE